MVRSIFARGPLYWLRAPKDSADVRLDERILVIVRLLLSACCLGAVVYAGSAPSLKVLALLYLFYSLLIILMLRIHPHLSPQVHLGIHCADILWATPLMILGPWPELLFAVFIFLMGSAALRWGFWEVLLTAGAFCVTMPLGSSVLGAHIPQLPHYGSISGLTSAGLFLAVIVCLSGLLAEASAVRFEKSFMASALEDIRLETGLDEGLHIICTHALQLYHPAQVLLVLNDRNSNQCRLYRLSRLQKAIQSSMLDSSQQKQYFFPAPAEFWRVAVGHSHSKIRFKCFLLKEGKIKKEKGRCGLPDSFLTAHPFSLMLAASHVYESGWSVRIYMLNPNRFVAGRAGLRFMERSLHKLAPVIHDAFLVQRLTSRAKAAASSRLARELHDGVIQSLSYIHLKLDELRLQAAPVAQETYDRIGHIQESIRKEISGLRDLTQQLRSVEIDSGRLLGFLSGMAMKFQCEHGITTRFFSKVEEVPLKPRVCEELARIVQEALANIRKHSGADEAHIYLDRRNGHWMLRITDNGCGFGFSGRRSDEELQVSRKGPSILMERAHAIGGSVAIQSNEGDGTCLEVTFPLDPPEIQG